MLMFSFEYKRIVAIFGGSKKMGIRDVNVSSSGLSDKTMGKFYRAAAFVDLLFS